MNKRRLLAIAIAVCLIAILACGSLAYFVADASVKNEFYVASYDPNNPDDVPTAEELFSIAIYETDENGQKDYDGLTYAGILPGAELSKDPTIVNTGEYSAYVRMKVPFDKTDKWTDAGYTDLTDLLDINTTEWVLKTDETVTDSTAKTITYVFYKETPLAKDGESTLVESVTIPESLTVEQFVTLANFNITVAGDAIQSENVGDTVYDAFEIFDSLG